MKKDDRVIMNDLAADYPAAKAHIVKLMKRNNVPRVMISETLLVFEALCYKIFEQRENSRNEVSVSGYRRMGASAIEILFEGGRFDPEPEAPSDFSPEDRILSAYADKIDYRYHSGRNKITITTKRNHLSTISIYAASIALGIVLCVLLGNVLPEDIQLFIGAKLIFPLEQLFVNAILMIGAPLTFLSMLKHLTDTYILAGSNSNARKLHLNTITSSILSVILAVASSWLITKLLFADSPISGKYPRGDVDLDPEQLIPSLIPSDIFTPFQSILPFSLIVLAIVTTYAFCSVGKYFDRIKVAIDAAYVLFARMLEIVMYALPLYAVFAVMDELFSDGFKMLGYLTLMIVVVFASLGILLAYYIIRLVVKGIRPLPFIKKMIPLLQENARIASAFDAVPYNIRYCTRTYGFDRKRMEQSMPVLAQINLDGNCFIITMTAMLYIAINSTPLSAVEVTAVGLLVLFLSLGAPNQPGSCLVSLSIVMLFLKAPDLQTIGIIAEVFFGGILNLTNIVGDIVTIATDEVQENGSAEKLNKMIS